MNWQPSFKFLSSFRETWKAIKALLGIRFQSTFLSTDCHSSLNWNTRKLYKPVIRNSSYRRSSCNIVIPLSKLLIGDISIFSLTTVVPATKGESKDTMLTSSLETMEEIPICYSKLSAVVKSYEVKKMQNLNRIIKYVGPTILSRTCISV